MRCCWRLPLTRAGRARSQVVATPVLAAPGKSHSLSPRLKDAVDLGRAPATERHHVV